MILIIVSLSSGNILFFIIYFSFFAKMLKTLKNFKKNVKFTKNIDSIIKNNRSFTCGAILKQNGTNIK